MKKKIIIAGGTGFVGKYLNKKFVTAGYDVVIISRTKSHVSWDNTPLITEALENAAILINLAGKSVDCRYNEKNKKEIYDSRITSTIILGEAILNCKNPPPLWINSSTATIYRHAEDRPMTEGAGEIGTGFSVNLATDWEKAFFGFKLPQTRQVAFRMAIVLGNNGGVIKPLLRLVRCGLGGKQGSGKQMFSWIHIEDLYRIIIFIKQHDELSHVINTCAPYPVCNKTLMQLLRNITEVAFGLPAPVWLLKMGAVIIKTETELILKSRWVIPERLLTAGFQFQYPEIDMALKQILSEQQQNSNQ